MVDEDLRKELANAAAVNRKILGEDSGMSWREMLIGHRRQCIENLRDSEDEWWADRIRRLDEIAEHEGIVLAYETSLRWVLDEIAERRRARTAEDIEHRRQGDGA